MNRYYMVGNTHFDPVWLWTWDEAMAGIRATFRSALDRMKEHNQYIYSFTTPPVFEWIRKVDPAMFEEIKQRVAEGRWELAEGWWVQPDCYSASGESYVRQGLYGQQYLLENFGKKSCTVFNVDSFGHSPMLPQILKKSGIEFYCLLRPEKKHIPLKQPLFRWASADGSEVLAYRLNAAWDKNLETARSKQEAGEQDAMMVFGVTDHGGAPTKRMLAQIDGFENAQYSTVEGFFRSHQECDYVVTDELLTGDFGVYANHPEIKKRNRIAEYSVMNAERASLIAEKYDSEKLAACWKDILFNQFHDILGGASIRDAYFDAGNTYGRAIQSAREITHFALQSVTAKMQTVGKNPDDIWNLVVWNLNGCDYDGYLEAEVQWVHEFDWYNSGIALMDQAGNTYPCQVITAKSVIPRFRSRFVFKAQIPAMGYKMFKVVQTHIDDAVRPIDPFAFDTDRVEVCFDRNDGHLVSVKDKKSGKLLCKDTCVPKCYYDDGDTWAFNIKRYSENPEAFAFEGARVIEAGALRTVIRMRHRFNHSLLDLYYTFYNDDALVDIRYSVNWQEKHYALKLEMPVDSSRHVVSVPYGSMERNSNPADMPMGPWLRADDITVITDGIFAYNMVEQTLGLTILRSAIYGDLRIKPIDYEDDYDILSQGITEGNIRLAFHGSPWEMSDSFLNRPIIIDESNHDGVLPCEHQYCSLEADSVAIGAIKKAEHSNGVVVRLFEYAGNSQQVKLRYKDQFHIIALTPYEIKTLLLQDGRAKEISMIEDM